MPAPMAPSPFRLKKTERTAVLIDGPSFFSTCKDIELEVDFLKLYNHFADRCDLYRITYYVVLPQDKTITSQVFRLKQWLENHDYTVVSKTYREFPAGRHGSDTGDADTEATTRRQRVNLHCEISNEMLSTAFLNRAERIILFSSDPDLLDGVRIVQSRGINVTLVSSLEARYKPSNELRGAAAGGFVDLNEDTVAEILEREERPPTAAVVIQNGRK